MMTTVFQPNRGLVNQRRLVLSGHPASTASILSSWRASCPDAGCCMVHFVPKQGPDRPPAIPEGITPADIAIRKLWGGGESLGVVSVTYPQEDGAALAVLAERPGDAGADCATYVLEIQPRDELQIDQFFARATFTIDAESVAEPGLSPPEQPSLGPEPAIDYLAKDYASFRRLMLDHLSQFAPQWRERHPADMVVMLVELLAYAADYLSYYQDAVATEAYLGTARRRTSVRRHARLLDYPLHEGCNARVWVQVQVQAERVPLPRGTMLLTRMPHHELRIPTIVFQPTERPASTAANPLMPGAPYQDPRSPAQAFQPTAEPHWLRVFETMHPAMLTQAHNCLYFHAWGFSEYTLEPGATSAALLGHHPELRVGDVLLFEEVVGLQSGLPEDADLRHRHTVRLTQPPLLTVDTLLDQPVTEITWSVGDALPFRLNIAAARPEGTLLNDISVARGNLVLADSGWSVFSERLEPVPEQGRYAPTLQFNDLVYCAPYDDAAARMRPASAALGQEPGNAMPALWLYEDGSQASAPWIARRDLLSSDRLARDVVVETENDGSCRLRFGDGVLGRRPLPDTRFWATYRIHNGPSGNIGAETIRHIVSNDGRIVGVRNPLPAQGGLPPQSIQQARLNAPQAFQQPQSCVTLADYPAAAEQHPDVRKVVAKMDWSGSWQTVKIFVDRRSRQPVDAAFRAQLLVFLEPYRLAGCALDIAEPYFVPLAIRLTVRVANDTFRSLVRGRLLERFSELRPGQGRAGLLSSRPFHVRPDGLPQRYCGARDADSWRARCARPSSFSAGGSRTRASLPPASCRSSQWRSPGWTTTRAYPSTA